MKDLVVVPPTGTTQLLVAELAAVLSCRTVPAARGLI